MKKLFCYFAIVFIACYIVMAHSDIESKAANNKRKIIVFKESVQADELKTKLIKEHNVFKLKDLSLI